MQSGSAGFCGSDVVFSATFNGLYNVTYNRTLLKDGRPIMSKGVASSTNGKYEEIVDGDNKTVTFAIRNYSWADVGEYTFHYCSGAATAGVSTTYTCTGVYVGFI